MLPPCIGALPSMEDARSSEEEARRLSTISRYALFLPSKGSQAEDSDPSPARAGEEAWARHRPRRRAAGEALASSEGGNTGSTAARGAARRDGGRRGSARRRASGDLEREDGDSNPRRGSSKRRKRGELEREERSIKPRQGSSRRSARGEVKRRRIPSSSSSSPPSGLDRAPSPPSPPPPLAASRPVWCWDCQIRLARPVEQPTPHLCLCVPCSAGGNRGCPHCNEMIWVQLRVGPADQAEAEQERLTFLQLLSRTARWNLSYDPPLIPFEAAGYDGSDARALPLVLARDLCSDCPGRRRPAVWIASCCQALLCSACLEPGLRRRHARCRTPCVLGLVRRARATLERVGNNETFYVWREVRLDLQKRVGADLLHGGRFVVRHFISMNNIHDRQRDRPARRRTVLYVEVVRDGRSFLLQMTY